MARKEPNGTKKRTHILGSTRGNTKAAEMREAIKRYEQRCVAMGQNLPLAELKLMAQTVFPAGSLPNESDPIDFAIRELEIFRNLQWKTAETEQRWMHAEVERAFRGWKV
jgi:hypothetical protein